MFKKHFAAIESLDRHSPTLTVGDLVKVNKHNSSHHGQRDVVVDVLEEATGSFAAVRQGNGRVREYHFQFLDSSAEFTVDEYMEGAG